MREQIKVYYDEKPYLVPQGTTLNEVKKLLNIDIGTPIIAAKVNGEILSLNNVLAKEDHINFLGKDDFDGVKIYNAGLRFLFEVAVKEVYKNEYKEEIEVLFNHSIGGGVHVSIEAENKITKELVVLVEEKMNELSSKNLIITKMNIPKKEAYSYYDHINHEEKD